MQTGLQLRQLFCTILLYCEPAEPFKLWEIFKRELSEDNFYRAKKEKRIIDDDLILNEALLDIGRILKLQNKNNKLIKLFIFHITFNFK